MRQQQQRRAGRLYVASVLISQVPQADCIGYTSFDEELYETVEKARDRYEALRTTLDDSGCKIKMIALAVRASQLGVYKYGVAWLFLADERRP